MKPKILFIASDHLGRSGVPEVIMNIVRALKNEFIFDIVIFMDDEDKTYQDEFMSYGGKIFKIREYFGKNKIKRLIDVCLRDIRFYYSTCKILRENGPYSAIHVHKAFESGFFIRAAKKMKVPVRIVHSHMGYTKSNFLPKKFWQNIGQKQILKYATVKICVSENCGKALFGSGNKYCQVMNTYDEDKFRKNAYPELVPNVLTLIQVATFSDRKNQLFTLEVFRNILKTYPDAEMNYVGFDIGAGYESLLKAEIAKHNLEKKVHLLPSDADTPKLLSTSSAFLLPSKEEGFGIVLIEAQAMGVHCYASDVVPRITDAGGVTYLSPSDGPEKWAEVIMEDFKRTGGVHENYDCTKFSQKEVMKIYRRLYSGEQI